MNGNHLPKIVAIVGPTASGKSNLAVKLAKKYNGEIVSADSRQIYKGMDIGTAKLKLTKNAAIPRLQGRDIGTHPAGYYGRKLKLKSEIPHYLIDIKYPNEEYSLAEYKKDAITAIRKILKRGKLPILAGGTGLYIKSITHNLDIPSVPADKKLRSKLEKGIKTEGLEYVFRKLAKLDPEAASAVDGKNPRRVVRAIEIVIKTGKPLSKTRKMGKQLFRTLIIGLMPQKKELKKRINARVDEMLKSGLVKEVEGLVKKYGMNQKAFDAIGYREIIAVFKKKTSVEKAAELIKRNTYAYARRQMTWFKKDKNVLWMKNDFEAMRIVRKYLTGR